jgi:hypothetical protein
MNPARYGLVAVLAAALLAGCGEKKETLGDPTAVYGPGITASAPPWKPEYAHLKQRIKTLGLPSVGKEQFHTHALIHIYNDGLLVEVARNIGIDPKTKAYSSVHTHDTSGIVHMESEKPFKFTLGDFFAIWGVPFGSKSLGSLKNDGDKQVRVYVNGKRIQNPAQYVMRDNDNISIGYGTDGSFPHKPDASPLKTVSGKGGKQANCSKGTGSGKKGKSCVKQD